MAEPDQPKRRFGDIQKRDLERLVGDPVKTAWLVDRVMQLLGERDALGSSFDESVFPSLVERKGLAARVAKRSEQLSQAIHALDAKSEFMGSLLHKRMTEEFEAVPDLWDEAVPSMSSLVVLLGMLQAAAEKIASQTAPPGRALNDAEAVLLNRFRLALIECGIKDSVGDQSKMGKAFAIFLEVASLPRTDVKAMLLSLRNWRGSHPSDTDWSMGLM